MSQSIILNSSMHELTTRLAYSPKREDQPIANFFRHFYPLRIAMANVQRSLCSCKVVVHTKNYLKAADQQSYLDADTKVRGVIDPCFSVPVKGGVIPRNVKMTTLHSGKCWGGSVHLAKAWLQRGAHETMTSIAQQYKGGLPKEAAELQDRYEYRYNQLDKRYDLDDRDWQIIANCMDFAHDRLSCNPFWFKNVPLFDRTFVEFKIKEAIHATIDDMPASYFLSLKSYMHAQNHHFIENELKILEVIAKGLEAERYGIHVDYNDFCLREEGLNPIESRAVDFHTAVKSFSTLGDGVYLLSIPCYGFFNKKISSHAIVVIIDQETSYFLDANFAVWETNKKDATSFGEGILWRYMHPGAVYNSEIFITKVGLYS